MLQEERPLELRISRLILTLLPRGLVFPDRNCRPGHRLQVCAAAAGPLRSPCRDSESAAGVASHWQALRLRVTVTSESESVRHFRVSEPC